MTRSQWRWLDESAPTQTSQLVRGGRCELLGDSSLSFFIFIPIPLFTSGIFASFESCLLPVSLNYLLYTHTHTHSPSFCPATAMSASGSGIPNAASGSSSGVKKGFPQVDLSGHDLPPSPAPSSPHTGRRYNIATELVFTEGSDQYNASSVPIYQVQIHPR